MNAKDELLSLLRLCNVEAKAIDVVEMAYELGYKAGASEANQVEPVEEAPND